MRGSLSFAKRTNETKIATRGARIKVATVKYYYTVATSKKSVCDGTTDDASASNHYVMVVRNQATPDNSIIFLSLGW
jgi:N-acetyl-anhydromuramyl-L-alanine amidase AmpD